MQRQNILITTLVLLIVAAIIGLNISSTDGPERGNDAEVVAENLEVPWDIEFLPGDDMLVTERPGTLLRVKENNSEQIEVDGVQHVGEGGLLGLALHPNYSQNQQIYLYMTTRKDEMLENRVVRYRLEENQLSNPETIIEGLPGAPYHDGGRIAFGPGQKLYITAGDATRPEWAQDTDTLAGKILRINSDGSIPEDNPFNNSVYSYGHRNPQGITWINNQLWSTEHGDRAKDELNKIEKGGNYGWPAIEGDKQQEGMITPVIHSGQSNTWAPAAAESTKNSIYFTGLRGNALYKTQLQQGQVTDISKHLTNYGRLREVEKRNGNLYISTSNTDGRGNPNQNDDKIIKVNPDNLN